ncbi:MAG: glycogen debranching protein GlgX [Chitinivibrionales bacterium]|nr:glycogen debranching protein GlgX [Chitinivibrionales bacterium]
MQNIKVWPGKPFPLGANWDGHGTNFSLYSEHATQVELLLFDEADSSSARHIIQLKERTAFIWHCYIPGVKSPQLYAYRVYGPFEPENGHRFNPNKVLLDPYAKALSNSFEWNDSFLAYIPGDPQDDLSFSETDSCRYVPKCVVTDTWFDWDGDRPMRYPWNETIIYEAHVKGVSIQHPDIEEGIAGSYEALAQPAIINHLKNLGITAIELLPIHQHVIDKGLIDRGLTNYWGYNSIAFFAPDCRYSSSGNYGEQVYEFKHMVKSLHKAGIEVILDVVYNHTAEGGHMGPTLCFRGIDNASYYHLSPENPRYYMDFSGCGTSFRMSHPHVTQLIMDSLRYWIQEMHVDGFRFDLASTLAREFYEVDKLSTFFDIIQQDPVISQAKLIAEPWDLGSGGYQVGNFPPLWTEWNGKYRDSIRRFWKGLPEQTPEIAFRLTGSSDLYQTDGRKPVASINFITCHDGFTLQDLVSYNNKHNEANNEDNRDGTNDNISYNYGVEGPSDDPEIIEIRDRQKRNFLATLLLSQGVPLFLGGDELGRTQNGNNNAYCQDNQISWFDWNFDDKQKALMEFVQELIKIRQKHPIFRKRKFFRGEKLPGSKFKDITWLKPDGREMSTKDWDKLFFKTIGILLNGEAIDEIDAQGNKITDDTFLMIINAHEEPVSFTLPPVMHKSTLYLYTSNEKIDEKDRQTVKGPSFIIKGRSCALLCANKTK